MAEEKFHSIKRRKDEAHVGLWRRGGGGGIRGVVRGGERLEAFRRSVSQICSLDKRKKISCSLVFPKALSRSPKKGGGRREAGKKQEVVVGWRGRLLRACQGTCQSSRH